MIYSAVLTDLRSKSLSELLDYDITPVFWKSNSTDDLSAEKRLSTSDFELNMPFQQYREYTYPLDCCGHPEENEGNEGVIEEEIELLPSLSVICEDEREMQHSETPQETGEPSTKLKRNSVPPIKFAELLGLKEESLEEGDSLDVQSLLPWDAEGNLRVSKSTENLRLKNSLSLPADISNQQNPQQQEDLDDEDKTPSYYVNLAHGIKEEASPKRFASGAELSETGGKDAQQGTSLDQSVPEESENLISAPQLDRSKSVSTPSISLSGSGEIFNADIS